MLLSAVACLHAARRLYLAAFSFALLIGFSLGSSAAAAAATIAPQQLTVTAANAAGDSIYDLSLATGSSGALISGIQALNSDGAKHGSFDALVWSPNAFTGTLDLIVADAAKGQILRYAGPNYGTSSVIFTYAGKGSGPAYPAGLAVDGSGNVFVISPSAPINATPALWVLPFNKAAGTWAAPVLIDQSFSGVRTLALAEVLVANTAATPVGSAAPGWNAGDVLVLVGDTFDSRVIVYSKAAIGAVLAKPKVALTGPTSTVVTAKQFLSLLAAPFGMDIWPADATHGVSLLFTTVDGRIIRFDTHQNAFASNFASGLGLGLTKLKVGSYAGKPYAFVAQLGLGSNGQILQFGAPPASGANKPAASVSKGVSEPIGLALTSSGSTPVSSCIAPQICSPLGPQLTVQISGPGASRIPPGATILQQACTVTDPRVQVAGGVWSCLPPSMNVCGATPTPGCVSATLDVANFCPGFPSTILPATMCGHAGPNGSSLQVVKSTAELLDENANDIYIQTAADPTVALPGPYDLGCQQGVGHQYGQVVAFAPRSDLPTIEGTIVEDAAAPDFLDISGYCDKGGGNTHVESMFAFGLGLNPGANGLGSGANGGLYGFVTTKFNNLSTTIQEAAPQITPQTVTTTLENYVTQSQTYFNSDYHNDVNDYSCALNSIASADIYLRNQANGTAFSYTAPAAGNNNPNPAGEIDGRLANLFFSISGDFLYAPNPTWPTTNVPPCVTLSITAPNNTVAVGGSATLTFGPPTPQFASTPLLFSPTQCVLSATDGTYATPTTLTATSGSVSTGTLTKAGTYTATLECAGAATDTSSSFATTSVPVTTQPTLQSISVTPQGALVADGQTIQYTATGNYSSGPSQTLNSVSWGTSNGVATISGSGLATCLQQGTTAISATSGNISGAVNLTCTAPVLTSISVSPTTATIAAGSTQQFTATGKNSLGNPTSPGTVTWASASTAIATISSSGLATCLAPGSSNISASNGTFGASATLNCSAAPLASITVTPASASVAVGGTQQFADTAKDSLGNQTSPGPVTWSSASAAVASISSTGLATCLAPGSSNITATNGSITSNSAVLTCLAGSVALSATPTTTPINTSVTLNWTGTNLALAGDTCTLTSNSSDAPLNLSEPASGSLTTTEAVSQNVTYTLACSGAAPATSSVSVLYTLTTTYQYTGQQFSFGNAHGDYTTADRVITSLTLSVPLPAGATDLEVTTLPGLVLSMSDGVQTLVYQAPITPPSPLSTPNTDGLGTVSTDGNGNITYWSLLDRTPVGVNNGSYITTQDEPEANEGAFDSGVINQGSGEDCISPTDCGANSSSPGIWTSSNALGMHVIVGTTSGTNPATGQLYQAIVGGSAAAPTLAATPILNQAPEPATCFSGGSSVASGVAAAVTSLAFVPNASTGFSDLAASNGTAGDEFLLSGPSYQPRADITNAAAGCSNKGPSQVVMASGATGTLLGAGVDKSGTLGLYYFPPNPTAAADYAFLVDVNNTSALTGTCNGQGTAAGCVHSLADTVVAPNTVAGTSVSAGDMLVLIGDPYAGNTNPVVLRVANTFVANPSSCPTGTTTPCYGPQAVGGSQLITQSTLTLQSGEAPVSMDLSALDGSLFIATSLGKLYELTPNGNGYAAATLYASGLSGIKQIRVGVDKSNVLHVFATVQGASNGIYTFVGAAPGGGFGTSGTGVAFATVSGTPAGLAVH